MIAIRGVRPFFPTAARMLCQDVGKSRQLFNIVTSTLAEHSFPKTTEESATMLRALLKKADPIVGSYPVHPMYAAIRKHVSGAAAPLVIRQLDREISRFYTWGKGEQDYPREYRDLASLFATTFPKDDEKSKEVFDIFCDTIRKYLPPLTTKESADMFKMLFEKVHRIAGPSSLRAIYAAIGEHAPAGTTPVFLRHMNQELGRFYVWPGQERGYPPGLSSWDEYAGY